jgi:hypothetical protein
MYGPLVLAHAIEAKQLITKKYAVAGLKEMTYAPVNKQIYLYNGKPLTKLADSKGFAF